MSLIVLIPMILLGIVGAFCFAGCVFETGGLASPFSDYTNGTVRKETSLMVFWPLNDKLKDSDNPAPAIELQSNIPSSYIDMATAPGLYPWLGTPIGIRRDPMLHPRMRAAAVFCSINPGSLPATRSCPQSRPCCSPAWW